MALVYQDTNAIILWVEAATQFATAFRQFLSKIFATPEKAITSELTLAELLAPTRRQSTLSAGERAELYGSLLLHTETIFMSNDTGLRQLPPSLKQVNADREGVEIVLAAFGTSAR